MPLLRSILLTQKYFEISDKTLKGTHYKSSFGGFKADIKHDCVLGISVNIPTKVLNTILDRILFLLFCPSCFYTFGRIDWVGWRLARGEDGRGWPTGVLQEIPQFSYKTRNCSVRAGRIPLLQRK